MIRSLTQVFMIRSSDSGVQDKIRSSDSGVQDKKL